MQDPEKIIKAIRESCGCSIAIYTQGNCYQFYEILKAIFPEAEAYESGHVWTKIGDDFYDIRGKLTKNYDLKPITSKKRIKSLSVNKWSDERRKECFMKEKLKLNESRR